MFRVRVLNKFVPSLYSLVKVQRQYEKKSRFSSTFVSLSLLSGIMASTALVHAEEKADDNEEFNINGFLMKKPTSNLTKFGGTKVLKNFEKIISYLQDPEAYLKSGRKQPKGILLSGPPGIGKTQLAILVAGHSGVPILIVSCSELIRSHIGKTEELMRSLFETARENAPCILLLDEFDSIALERTRRETNQWDRTMVNQLLTLLSSENKGVVIIAVTNNYYMLDRAVVRQGRFDQHIMMTLPDKNERLEILNIYLQNKSYDSTVKMEDLAELCAGYSGAQIEAWVDKTINIALDEKRKASIKDFNKAKILIESGTEETIEKNLTLKKQAAIHEMGHTLVGHYLGERLYRTTVKKANKRGNTTFYFNEDQKSANNILNQICIVLAGYVAEKIYGLSMLGSKEDLEIAKYLANQLIENGYGSMLAGFAFETDIEAILQEQMNRASTILKKHQKEGDYIIESLMLNDEIFGYEISSILLGKTTRKKLHWPFSSNDTSDKKASPFQLPSPKAQYKERPLLFTKPKQEEKIFPFSIEEVGKLLEIDPQSIRSITLSENGGARILFKPSFLLSSMNNRHFWTRILTILKEADVDFYAGQYLPTTSGNAYIDVSSSGYDDFIKLLEKTYPKSNKPASR